MNPQTLKEWADVLTAPAILAIIGVVFWKMANYVTINFVSPLGGHDGKIAHFFESTQRAIQTMPDAVGSLEGTYKEIGDHQSQMLSALVEQHKSPDKFGFGTTKTNEIVSDTRDMVSKLLRAKKIMSEILVLLSGNLSEEEIEIVNQKAKQVSEIIGKHE